jgi:RNA polymerase sigma-70 factor, ECF subfamily
VLSEETALDSALACTAQGDLRAFRRVHELTRVHLLSVALRIVRQRELAEDVLQDVYVAVWQRAGQYDPAIARPMTWLITMVRHRAIDLLRSRHKGGWVEPGEALREPTESGWLDDSAQQPERHFDAARVGAYLQRLSPPHRQSVALAYYHGLSHSQVAERLGAPIGSVKSWIRRGLDQLRQCIEAGATP